MDIVGKYEGAITMSIKQEYGVIFKPIYEYFNNNLYNIRFFDFNNIYFTDNITEDIFLFDTPRDTEDTNCLAATILPNDKVNTPTVLININTDSLVECSNRLLHELVHIYDFKIYSDYFLRGLYQNMIDHTYFSTYRFWSEFKAFSTAEYHKYIYVDLIENTRYTDEMIMCTYENDLKEFLLRERNKILVGNYTSYNLVQDLAQIYILDNYKKISDVSLSYSLEYIPMLFDSEIQSVVFELYNIYFRATRNLEIFELLCAIQDIESKVFPLI